MKETVTAHSQMKVCYKIYTEDLNKEDVIDEIQQFLGSFTVYSTTGYWKGTEEEGLVIEVIATDSLHDQAIVRCVSKAIQRMNKQESILVTKHYQGELLL